MRLLRPSSTRARLNEMTRANPSVEKMGVKQAASESGNMSLDPEELADRILADLIGDRAVSDDVALVVVRRPPDR